MWNSLGITKNRLQAKVCVDSIFYLKHTNPKWKKNLKTDQSIPRVLEWRSLKTHQRHLPSLLNHYSIWAVRKHHRNKFTKKRQNNALRNSVSEQINQSLLQSLLNWSCSSTSRKLPQKISSLTKARLFKKILRVHWNSGAIWPNSFLSLKRECK